LGLEVNGGDESIYVW